MVTKSELHKSNIKINLQPERISYDLKMTDFRKKNIQVDLFFNKENSSLLKKKKIFKK